MNILEHIKELCKKQGWTVYKLADEAGITQSTITNMFYRKTLPSITTLTSICNAFGITLSQFFNETNSTEILSQEEETLILKYRQLTKKDKKIVNVLITEMTNDGK